VTEPAPTPQQVAVVTGAASGIGRACTEKLGQEGWFVVGWDISPGDDPAVSWRRVDVGDYASVEAAAADVPVASLLVNCAGISDRAPAAEMSVDQWDRVIRVDLSGTFYCCRSLHDALAQGHGTIVNVASIAAHRSFHSRANYCAAKAGVVALTEVLGLEWADSGVRVVAVSPGFVASPMMAEGVTAGHIEEEAVLGRTPQDRFASAEEIAAAIVSLASSAFAFMTGTTVVVDGGWCANGGF
jgi:NAD(P)-dependent dehydrogenase (short-subunit alcohol dehydrogenase family)